MKETRRSYIVLRIANSWGVLHYYIILLLFKFMPFILFIRNLLHLKYCSFKAHICKFYIYSHCSQMEAGKVWFSHSYVRVLSSKATQQTSLNFNFWSNCLSLILATQSMVCRAATSRSPGSLLRIQNPGSRPDLLNSNLLLLSSPSDCSVHSSLRNTSFCHSLLHTELPRN